MKCQRLKRRSLYQKPIKSLKRQQALDRHDPAQSLAAVEVIQDHLHAVSVRSHAQHVLLLVPPTNRGQTLETREVQDPDQAVVVHHHDDPNPDQWLLAPILVQPINHVVLCRSVLPVLLHIRAREVIVLRGQGLAQSQVAAEVIQDHRHAENVRNHVQHVLLLVLPTNRGPTLEIRVVPDPVQEVVVHHRDDQRDLRLEEQVNLGRHRVASLHVHGPGRDLNLAVAHAVALAVVLDRLALLNKLHLFDFTASLSYILKINKVHLF